MLFVICIVFSAAVITNYKKSELNDPDGNRGFFSSKYVFDSLPALFPTLGIGLTAAGIVLGLWDFDIKNTQTSISELLEGLKFSFIATIAGILGLIIFQKITENVQTKIDNNPNKPKRSSDELTALSMMSSQLGELVTYFKDSDATQSNLQTTALQGLAKGIIELKLDNADQAKQMTSSLGLVATLIKDLEHESAKRFESERLRAEKAHSESINLGNYVIAILSKQEEIIGKNIEEVVRSIHASNDLLEVKFDEFTDLLKKSNTEALVEVMKEATAQFNEQMTELINKLVKENFAELNNSVKNMVDWQRENKEQISVLTAQFNQVQKNLAGVDTSLMSVGKSLSEITDDSSNLRKATNELKEVFVESGTLNKAATNLEQAAKTNNTASAAYAMTTKNLQDWVAKEIEFRKAAENLVVALNEVSNMKSTAWELYRSEMKNAATIIKDSNSDLTKAAYSYNAEFYERLSNTLSSLDQCIQRMVIAANKR